MIIDNVEALFTAPEFEETEVFPYAGVKQYFYRGLPYKGRQTKVFGCCGFPEHASPDKPVPGIVLVHGGGATALANWVSLWVERGYAAISMDTCGCVPCWAKDPYFNQWPQHEFAGPRGWGNFELAMENVQDQWVYHALGAVIAGHSLLRSFPQVDASRIGVTGISWGGVLTLLAAAHDPRFAFAEPVYGTGFLNSVDSVISYRNPDTTDEQRKRWFELFDPAHTLKNISMPCFMLAGTNDKSFPADGFWKTAEAIPSPVRILMHREYPHNHTISFQENTIWAFAERVLNKSALPTLTECICKDGMLQCQAEGANFTQAILCWSCGGGLWNGRKWEQCIADISKDGVITHPLPRNARAAYFTASAAHGEQYSSMPWILPED